ncbi:phage portal protein [Rhizobium sp. TH2]|uniref:phage portal protein n=1 Tax=Rhizobium sp. TH2 TaxID=2775403 RepID=UPI0021578692|nr:phage portal protein [Rhizobium sp. TH2]UVC10191.1 phage portal protein [Rhizobium sp. TH2]
MPFTAISNIAKKAFGYGVEQKSVSLADPGIGALFGIVPTASNIEVGVNGAIRVPAVACAISLISDTIGSLPAKVYQRDTKATAREHPAYKLVHDEANDWTSASQLRVDLTIDALMQSNGYALVSRASDGRPLELHRLEPGKVQYNQEDDGTPYYLVSVDRGQVRYEYTDILHIQPFGGVSPIVLGREAIALSIAFERHIASLFANGGRPSGVITAKKSLDADAKKKLAASWFNTHAGSNAGGTAILDEEMGYQQLSATLADSQFAENRLEQIREIARLFRVPPTMLFELTRGTWSNTEEMARQFYTITLKPWLTAWAWAYARVLLTPEERELFYIEFVTDDLLTTDFSKKATALGQYRSMGAMTGNEVRGMLNMQPHPDGNSLSNPHITTTPAAPAIEPSKEDE